MNTDSYVSVAAITPFWIYAVGPTSALSPAIPFYTKAGACSFFEKAKRELPHSGVRLYKRRFFRGLEMIEEYQPS